MTVKELYEVAEYSRIELHSGLDGKLIASSRAGIEKYAEAKVLTIIPKFKVSKHSGDYATAYLYVFINYGDIRRINADAEKALKERENKCV